MPKLYQQLTRKEELMEQDITQMYQMMEKYYENVNPTRFLRILSKKDYVYFLRNAEKKICAFTTLQRIHIIGKKKKMGVLLLGNVVTGEVYKKDCKVTRIYEDAIIQYKKKKEKWERYAFLECRDYETYQMFFDSFPHSYSCDRKEMPKHVKKMLHVFRENYNCQESDTVAFQKLKQKNPCRILCIAEITENITTQNV